MLYYKEITVPANTTINNYQKDIIKITGGKIKRLEVFFPWGCAALCGIQIIRHTWQLMPLSRGRWLIGNDKTFSFNYNFEIIDEPYELIIKSYNLDDTFDHSPIITVEMSRGELSLALQQLVQELER